MLESLCKDEAQGRHNLTPRVRVAVLGGGPAGLGAAFHLRRRQQGDVVVLEQRDTVGGNAGSFVFGGQRLDYGSHRLHPTCDKEILQDIRSFLADDLLDRPRHGRIRLAGRWIHFPLKPLDILTNADRRLLAGIFRDMAGLGSRSQASFDGESYASVLWESLGSTICRHFYFPYARKIWGVEPECLSSIQARRRVSANSFSKLIRKIAGQLPGLRKPGAGRFYYPRRGYGQISDGYAHEARSLGAEMFLGWRVAELRHPVTPTGPWTVVAVREAERRQWQADHVWSTIPITLLAKIVRPEPSAEILEACNQITYRAMVLVYLQLPVQRFSEYDAHYFPSPEVAITRLSEPKNYAGAQEPTGSTVVCAELPCSPEDPAWKMEPRELADLVMADLERVGLALPAMPVDIQVRRLRQAYPIYLQGYERLFGKLDEWAQQLPRLLTYGRQGLFAHDNTHHALYMAYAAANCLTDDGFDEAKWQEYRELFLTHVVED